MTEQRLTTARNYLLLTALLKRESCGWAVLSFQSTTEREERKRIESLAKERLLALKAEAYMKLIDTRYRQGYQ
jgi:hypothetical protein